MNYKTSKFEREKRARRLYHVLVTPTLQNFKALLRMNAIAKCHIKMDYVDISENIFRPYSSIQKGKSIRNRPNLVRRDYNKTQKN